MKILYIHNDYAGFTGEEHASQSIAKLLTDKGHDVKWYKRSSLEISKSMAGSVKAFFTGIYNPFTPSYVKRKLQEYQPDLVIVQNIYPLISPSVFKALKDYGVPVVMRCPNYRLFCPNGLFLDTAGNVCEKCTTKGRELWAAKKNCLNSKSKSLGYALRGFFSRKSRLILNNVDVFIVQTEFQKQKFISMGIPEDKLAVVPGLTPDVESEFNEIADNSSYVSFVGRVSYEKGIDEFLRAAKMLEDIPFAVAGKCENQSLITNSSKNVKWMGFLGEDELVIFYLRSRIIVVPSKWYEGFPNVITRAMQMKKAVIASNIGAMRSIVDDRVTGLLFTPGDVRELSERIAELYYDDELCKIMGKQGFEKSVNKYSANAVYESLESAFELAKNNRQFRN